MSDESPAKRGRPDTYTKEKADLIVKYVRAGNYRKVAAEGAGVSYATLGSWCRNHPDFVDRLKEAESEVERELVDAVLLKVKDDPQHAKWWLERKAHERWGRRDVQKQELKAQLAVKHELSPELAALLAQVIGGSGQ